jgi:hypothetical protein
MRQPRALFLTQPPPQLVRLLSYGSTQLWNKKANLLYIDVEIQAAGGSSDGVDSGGAGGYSRKIIPAHALANQEIITVGGTCSFGSHLQASVGGNGGAGFPGGGGGASGGDINIPGEGGIQNPGETHMARSFMTYYGSGGYIASGPQVVGPGGAIIIVREYYTP